MEQDPNSVTVHYRTAAGRFQVRGDYAICAIPFSVMREIEVLNTPFSREKQKAIRELSYNASTKILFQTRHRFWEQQDGIVGGTTVTDLGIRRICYPSFSDPNEERGTLLASYTWGQDALRWGAMTPRSIPRSRPSSRWAPRRTGTAIRGRAVPLHFSSPSSRPDSRAPSFNLRAGSTLRASTRRCTTRGSRAPSSRASVPPRRSTRRPRSSPQSTSKWRPRKPLLRNGLVGELLDDVGNGLTKGHGRVEVDVVAGVAREVVARICRDADLATKNRHVL